MPVIPILTPPPPDPYQPAASSTDSPARGIPRPSYDPGKMITGGFGEPAEGQYFPLTGEEIKVAVFDLFDQLVSRIQHDLYFGIAMTYPQARVTVMVTLHAGEEPQTTLTATYDEAVLPPDGLRDKLQIAKPFKHTVGSGTRRQLIDVDAGPLG
jgi:hypothetical protein